MRQPRIELGAQRWQRWILPLNHWHMPPKLGFNHLLRLALHFFGIFLEKMPPFCWDFFGKNGALCILSPANQTRCRPPPGCRCTKSLCAPSFGRGSHFGGLLTETTFCPPRVERVERPTLAFGGNGARGEGVPEDQGSRIAHKIH